MSRVAGNLKLTLAVRCRGGLQDVHTGNPVPPTGDGPCEGKVGLHGMHTVAGNPTLPSEPGFCP